MLDLHILTIPHDDQRYDTVGDFFPVTPQTAPLRTEAWAFRISDLGNRDHELLVAIHELVEWWWAQKQGISNAAIDAFDMAWKQAKGRRDVVDEPGDDPTCPVYPGHQLASGIERICAAMLGIDWTAYEAAFDRLPVHPSVAS